MQLVNAADMVNVFGVSGSFLTTRDYDEVDSRLTKEIIEKLFFGRRTKASIERREDHLSQVRIVPYLVIENSDEIPFHRQSLFKLHRDRIWKLKGGEFTRVLKHLLSDLVD